MILNGLYVLLIGYVLGLSLAAPPGPINAIIMNESSKSMLHGTTVGAGAMTADLAFLIALYYGRIAIPPWTFKYLYIIGAAVLVYLSVSVIRSKMPSKTRGGNYLVGLTVGITNPFEVIWWVTAGLFLIERMTLLAVAGFFMGIVTWILAFPYAMNKVGSAYSPLLKVFSFLILLAFAGIMLFYGIGSFL